MRERALIAELLAPLATHRAARGLRDDAAVWLPPLGREVVLTHDVIASGVHYRPADPPSDIAWKLLAVNLSDLAAMGATPAGVLLSLTLGPTEDEAWLRSFVAGLARGLERWEVALLGGDTVRWGAAAVLGCTAVGHVAQGQALGRGGARVGDTLWVSGTIGDAGLGLSEAKPHPPRHSGEGRNPVTFQTQPSEPVTQLGSGLRRNDDQGDAYRAPGDPAVKYLRNRYLRPEPRLALGHALGGVATAALDVSDGLLIDAERLALASGVALEIDLTALPVSPAAAECIEAGDTGRLQLATAGDDYELLFTAAADVATLATAKVPLTRIGRVVAGAGLRVLGEGGAVLAAQRLGWEH